MKNCKNCIHWKDEHELHADRGYSYIRNGYKLCGRQIIGNADDCMEEVVEEYGQDGYHSGISTGPEFCCKHHLAKNNFGKGI